MERVIFPWGAQRLEDLEVVVRTRTHAWGYIALSLEETLTAIFRDLAFLDVLIVVVSGLLLHFSVRCNSSLIDAIKGASG